jgi:hypothetical protein
MGSNAAEAHPVSMLHILHAKENGAKIIVADPRFTRTAAKADHFVRIRSGSDIPILYGVLRHIFENGWEDKQYIEDRVYRHGQDPRRGDEVDAEKVEEVSGVPDEQVKLIAETMAKNKPSTVVWCMGQTQHTTGNAIVRMMCTCSWHSAMSVCPAAAPTSSVATTTCRARPTSARTRIRCPATTALRPVRGSTGRAFGASITSGSRAASRPRR